MKLLQLLTVLTVDLTTSGIYSPYALRGMDSMTQCKKEIETGLRHTGTNFSAIRALQLCVKEVFIVLAQSMFLSERKATKLNWSCTVNLTGRVGCNIPYNLQMERSNRRL